MGHPTKLKCQIGLFIHRYYTRVQKYMIVCMLCVGVYHTKKTLRKHHQVGSKFKPWEVVHCELFL